jgi:hypothetical protein
MEGEMEFRRVSLALAVFTLSLGGSAMAVEEPRFRTVLKDGAFEVRDYPALTVAEVTVTGDQSTAAGRGFRLLAGYIFGANQGSRKIAMTAPVVLARAGEKIAMTAPVAQTREGDAWVVRFTMPANYSLSTLPTPTDPQIRLRTLPPTRDAVLRFSGWAFEGAVKTKTLELKSFETRHRLTALGPVTLAQYDPPWTLPFLRRNEVMQQVAVAK